MKITHPLRTVFRPWLILMAAASFTCAFTAPNWSEMTRRTAENLLNAGARDFFAGTLRVEKAQLDQTLRLKIDGIRGEIATPEKPVMLALGTLATREPLWRLLLLKPVTFEFSGLKPSGSSSDGLSGTLIYTPGWHWALEAQVAVHNLNLAEIAWVNPDNLAGSSGQMAGEIRLSQNAAGESDFSTALLIAEPGGKLQARFFDSVTPYLPKKKKKTALEKLASTHDLVGYSQASLEATLKNADTVKAVFRIMVPEYNLNLNLKMTVKVDEKNAFMKLFQLLGLLQAKAS